MNIKPISLRTDLVTGAVNCDDVWMFNEVASVGLPPTNLSTLRRGPVIPWGVQPRNQLSLDLPMVENYVRKMVFSVSICCCPSR